MEIEKGLAWMKMYMYACAVCVFGGGGEWSTVCED